MRPDCPQSPSKRTVVVFLMGGLGNQMFQYAHGLAVARKCSATLKLFWDKGHYAVKREFALNRFGLELANDLPPEAEWLCINDYGGWRPGMEDEIPEMFNRSTQTACCLRGYFQNETLFATVADEIRALFGTLRGQPAFPPGRIPVAVHVRRTDFLISAEHSLCGAAYFRTAMSIMKDLLDRPFFLIFSDDVPWCLETFPISEDVTVVPPAVDRVHFENMLACQAFIIPNSTFSWWAAWLSGAATVVCPDRFLKGAEWRIAPKNWLQIPPDGSITQSILEQRGGPTLATRAAPNPSQANPKKILVGICSSMNNQERRRAVRETWLSKTVPGIEYRFFIGGAIIPNETDVLALTINDSYDHLPSKVRCFFQAALLFSDFDWLFKCDDDTYVALDRLHELADSRFELIGNEFIGQRGSPSGGAGYFLSRRMVSILAADNSLPEIGAEDVILGEAAIRHGATAHATSRLCWNNSRFPSHSNDIVTSHWCSPEKLHMIHSDLGDVNSRTLRAVHACWSDDIILHSTGFFRRVSTACKGEYVERENGTFELRWMGWDTELLVPNGDYFLVIPLPVISPSTV